MARDHCDDWNVNYITFQWFTIGLFSKYTENVNTVDFVVVVALLFYIHGKHLRSCRDGQLT